MHTPVHRPKVILPIQDFDRQVPPHSEYTIRTVSGLRAVNNTTQSAAAFDIKQSAAAFDIKQSAAAFDIKQSAAAADTKQAAAADTKQAAAADTKQAAAADTKQAAAADIKQTAALLLRIYNDSYTIFENVPAQDIPEVFEAMLQTEHTSIIYRGSTPVGFASFAVKQTHLLISALYIRCKEQRRGLGTLLLHFIEQQAVEMQRPLLVLKALRQFPWTSTFYEKYGFVPCSQAADLKTGSSKGNTADGTQSVSQSAVLTEQDCAAYFPAKPWETVLIKHVAVTGMH